MEVLLCPLCHAGAQLHSTPKHPGVQDVHRKVRTEWASPVSPPPGGGAFRRGGLTLGRPIQCGVRDLTQGTHPCASQMVFPGPVPGSEAGVEAAGGCPKCGKGLPMVKPAH